MNTFFCKTCREPVDGNRTTMRNQCHACHHQVLVEKLSTTIFEKYTKGSEENIEQQNRNICKYLLQLKHDKGLSETSRTWSSPSSSDTPESCTDEEKDKTYMPPTPERLKTIISSGRKFHSTGFV